jgi:hypothetical protein
LEFYQNLCLKNNISFDSNEKLESLEEKLKLYVPNEIVEFKKRQRENELNNESPKKKKKSKSSEKQNPYFIPHEEYVKKLRNRKSQDLNEVKKEIVEEPKESKTPVKSRRSRKITEEETSVRTKKSKKDEPTPPTESMDTFTTPNIKDEIEFPIKTDFLLNENMGNEASETKTIFEQTSDNFVSQNEPQTNIDNFLVQRFKYTEEEETNNQDYIKEEKTEKTQDFFVPTENNPNFEISLIVDNEETDFHGIIQLKELTMEEYQTNLKHLKYLFDNNKPYVIIDYKYYDIKNNYVQLSKILYNRYFMTNSWYETLFNLFSIFYLLLILIIIFYIHFN